MIKPKGWFYEQGGAKFYSCRKIKPHDQITLIPKSNKTPKKKKGKSKDKIILRKKQKKRPKSRGVKKKKIHKANPYIEQCV